MSTASLSTFALRLALAHALATTGHRARLVRGVFGGYQTVRYDAEDDVCVGASESRQDRLAAGF